MNNPWVNLPSKAPFILEIDHELVEKFNTDENRLEEHRIHTELLPEPYLGDPFNASVFLLNLNPGYSPDDVKFYDDPKGRQAVLGNLTHEPSPYPFFMLDPEFENFSGPGWWRERLKYLIAATNEEQVAKKVCCIEYFPYHTQRFGTGKLELESQWYSFELVRNAIADKKIIVVMRAEAFWKYGVPELRRSSYYTLNSPQNVRVTPGNLPDGGFEHIVEAVKA